MNNFEKITTRLTTFLQSEKPGIFSLKGEWGVGKTHLWRKAIKKIKFDGEFKAPIYISLFGLNSIDALSQAVVRELLRSMDPTKEGSIGSAFDRIKLHMSSVLKVLPENYQTISNLVTSSLLLESRQLIICLDDIERSGNGLSLIEVFGFADRLRNQQDCKIILLFDDAHLDDNLSIYQEYREKVIDIESTLIADPQSALEAAAIAEETEQFLLDAVRDVGLKNIRLIRKTAQHYQEISELFDLAQTPDSFRRHLIRSLVLFVYVQHRYGDKLAYFKFNPTPIEDILNQPDEAFSEITDQTSSTAPDDDDKALEDLVRQYGAPLGNKLDDLLIEYVETGAIDPDELKQQLDHHASLADRIAAGNALTEVWSTQYASFQLSEVEVVSQFETVVRDHMQHYSVTELGGVIDLLVSLEKTQLAESLVDLFITTHQSNPVHLSIPSHRSIPDLLRDKIQALPDSTSSLSFSDALEEVSTGSWSLEASSRVENSSISDCEDLIQGSHPDTWRLVQTALEYQNGDVAEHMKTTVLNWSRANPDDALTPLRLKALHVHDPDAESDADDEANLVDDP